MKRRDMVMENFDKYRDYTADRVFHDTEKNRKGYAYLTLKDAQGKPLSGVRVKAVQKSHDFRFGANLFMLDEMETEEKNAIYRQYFRDTFNMATIPFYWNTLEPEQGKTRYEKDAPKIYRRPSPDLCLEFCEENGIEPREHALAYEHMFPEWLRGKSNREVKFLLEKRFAEIAERYAHRIPTIEVTNEMFWGKGVTDFYNAPDFIEWCFKTAEKYFPANELVINEVTEVFSDPCYTTSYYYSIIEKELLKGARIDAIGMQYHCFQTRDKEQQNVRLRYNPVNLFQTLDTYSVLGKPLQITEVSIAALSNDAEDEEVQAELLEKLYRIWFSHKNVEQIVYWNLPDGYAHGANSGDMQVGENRFYAGLLRFDLTPKPAYNILKKLIHEQWHTEAEMVTDQMGRACFKGFYGNYALCVMQGNTEMKKDFHLSKKEVNEVTITLPKI